MLGRDHSVGYNYSFSGTESETDFAPRPESGMAASLVPARPLDPRVHFEFCSQIQFCEGLTNFEDQLIVADAKSACTAGAAWFLIRKGNHFDLIVVAFHLTLWRAP
jgi:hypothetical protein